MANSVDLVIGSEAIKQVESLISKLSLADAELLKISQSATSASKGISGISTPSGLDKAVSNTSALNAELERQNTIIKSLEIEIKKLSYARQNNNKQSAEESVNQRILNQNAIAQAKSTSNLVGAYQKLDLEHKKAIVNAQNLGVKYGITSTQFLKASASANKMDNELKQIDSTLGKSQRNVGNYTNETFQLTQVLRELPAFTYSAQTGLLGISNNLPMLADGFKQVSQATNETTGKVNGTIGALKIFGASIFSMGNIFTIAIGLFTIFSKEIFEFIKGTNKGTTATKDFSKALEDSSKSIGKELVELDKLYRAATNTNIAYKERKQAVDRLQELYPLYFKNIKDEIILAGEAKTAYEDLTKALINKAIVGAFDEQASELASKLPKLYKELDRLNKLKQEALSAAPPTTSTFSSGVPMGVQTAANSPLAGIDASIEKTTKDIEALKSAMDQLYKLASNFSAGIDIGGSSMGGGKSPRTKTVKDKQVN